MRSFSISGHSFRSRRRRGFLESHLECNDCRSCEYDLYQSSVGSQNSIYGRYRLKKVQVLSLQSSHRDFFFRSSFLQLQSPKDTSQKPYKHTGDAFYQIFRTEGVKGFYKGLLPSLLGVSHVAVQFPLYEAFKGWARDKKKSDLLIKGEDDGDFELEASTILGCSSSAKMIASVMTYPHEVLRTKMQMQPRTSGGGSNGSGNGNGNGNGNGSRSFSTSTIGNQRQDFSNKGFQNQISTTTQNRISNSHWLPFRRRFSASIQNHNSTQSSSTTPTTVRNGNPYSGVLKICKSIATEEGIRGFYRGMGVNLIRTVPSSALTILTWVFWMMWKRVGEGRAPGSWVDRSSRASSFLLPFGPSPFSHWLFYSFRSRSVLPVVCIFSAPVLPSHHRYEVMMSHLTANDHDSDNQDDTD